MKTEISPLNSIFGLITFLPGLAVAVRRLHDIDRTGWWFLIALTIIELIVLLVWACQKGTTGPNRYGPDPLGGADVRRPSTGPQQPDRLVALEQVEQGAQRLPAWRGEVRIAR